MRLHYIQHVEFEDPANILEWAAIHGHPVSATHTYKNEKFPLSEEYDWLVVMGGPMNIYEDDIYPWLVDEKEFIRHAIAAGKTVIGICLGAQLLADALGGKVVRNREKEIGWFPIRWTMEAKVSPYFRGMPEIPEVFHWHGDTFAVPDWTLPIASSEATDHQGFMFEDDHALVIGLQFHIESSPESVQRLIGHSRSELMNSQYIQDEETMMERGENYKTLRRMIETFMDNVYAARK
jgi:GMP synthase (glutamine-hydrolysing)